MKNYKFNICMLLLLGAISNISAHYCNGLLDKYTCYHVSFSLCKWQKNFKKDIGECVQNKIGLIQNQISCKIYS